MDHFAAPFRHLAARRLALVALLLCPGQSLLRAQSSDALKLTILPAASGEQSNANLGYSVASDGNFIVLGAPNEYAAGSVQGVVKVFNATTGALLHVLTNPRTTPSELYGGAFGWAVAISAGRLVVGSPVDGAAHVYNLAGPAPAVPVLSVTAPNPDADGFFGGAVAIAGLRVLVSDKEDDTGAVNAGSVFVYNLASASPAVPVTVLNNPAPANNDAFGSSVAAAGTRVLVGAVTDDAGTINAGSAYLYDLAGATPSVPVGTLTSSAPNTDRNFGHSVALSGTIAAVGAPGDSTGATAAGRVFIFDLAAGAPFPLLHTLGNPSPSSSDRFGGAVAVSGSRVIVGSANDDAGGLFDSGSAYVYDIAGGTPTVPVATLANPNLQSSDNFGASVAFSGARIVVGTPGDDSAAANTGAGFVFDLTGGTPAVPVLTLNHAGPGYGQMFGTATAVSGSRVVTGSPYDDTGWTDAGIVTIHDLSSGNPGLPVFTLTNPNPAVQNFGMAVAIEGNRVVVGATGGTEAVYVFDLAGATPTVPVFTFAVGTSAGPYDFGFSVAISGTRIAVGTPGVAVGGGAATGYRYGRVYVFDTASASPTAPVLSVINTVESNSTPGFGSTVALSGTRLAVGAPENTANGVNYAGQVFVYDLQGTAPEVPVHVLQKSTPVSSDSFGYSIAWSGARLAVGIPSDNTTFSNAGAVQVFDLAGTAPASPVLVINNPGPGGSAPGFGLAVALSGARLAAGCQENPATGSERVLLFNIDRAAPTVPTAIFTRTDGNDAAFGFSVAVDGPTLAVGAPGYDGVLPDKGAAFIYGPASTLTQAPTLTAPATGALFTSNISVNFTLPEAALPGSVKLSFQKNATPHVFTLAATEETAGAHSFSFSPASPTATTAIASGTALPDGLYTVALSYQDAIGSYAATSIAATNVRVDRTAPVVTPPAGGFTPLLLAAPAVAPDYTVQAVVTDLGGISSITQSPPPGTALAAGSHLVTITATDFAGFTGSTSFTVTVLTFTQDTDGDGLNDASELQMAAFGFNWQVAQPSLVSTLFNSANGAGLYTTSQVQALNLDVPLLARNPATGLFKLTIGVQKSTDLQTFAPFPMTAPQTNINAAGQLEFFFTAPDNAAFFRVEPGNP